MQNPNQNPWNAPPPHGGGQQYPQGPHGPYAGQNPYGAQGYGPPQPQIRPQMDPYGGGGPLPQPHHGQGLNEYQSRFFTRVFGWMTMGLGITAVVAWLVAQTGFYAVVLPLVWPLFLVQIGLVFFLSARAMKMSPQAAAGTFLFYAAINGLTLSVIFLIYSLGSIAITFLATTMMFGFMFVWGLVTKKDLSGMGSFLFMALVGLIIASIVNYLAFQFGWFPPGTNMMMYWGITYLGILIFAGLIMYDAQKLKNISAEGFANGNQEQSVAIIGALMLYLDFINLFILLLRIFGRR